MTDETSEARWRLSDGSPLSCAEKLRVLDEGLEELRQMAQELFEDALTLECDEAAARDALAQVIRELKNPYRR